MDDSAELQAAQRLGQRRHRKPLTSWARPTEQPAPFQAQNAGAVASAAPFVGRVGVRLALSKRLLPTKTPPVGFSWMPCRC
jgi:hypothetical protein